MTKDQAITPCPFCGHVGDLDFCEGSTFRWLQVNCGQCSASVGETRIQTIGEGTPAGWLAQAKQEGIEIWNERTPAPDCRTCEHLSDSKRYCATSEHWMTGCTNGDKYQPAPAVVLWRTE